MISNLSRCIHSFLTAFQYLSLSLSLSLSSLYCCLHVCRYVRKYLKVMGKLSRESDRDRKLSHKFAQMYLRQDGVFVLKLVAKNSTDLVVADIVSALWENYKNKPIFGTRADEMELDDVGGGGGGGDMS